MAVRSKKPKAVALVKWLTKKGVEKIQEEHQQAIEKKDAAIALLNDDLQNREYENVALRAQRDVLHKCKLNYTNVKIPSPILKHVMFLMQKIQVKTTLSLLYGNIQHLPTINIMTCHIVSRGYNNVKGMLN